MVLTIDIGNTHIVLGAFDGDKIVFTSRIKTDHEKTEFEYASVIKSIVELYGFDSGYITGAVMSCVVPPLVNTLKIAVKLCFDVETIVVGPGIKTGIMLKCDAPGQVGADLICACVAAHELYNEATIIIDMGTVTKILLIDEDGVFSGAIFAPGVGMGINALASGTAQLPKIGLDAPDSVVGTNTTDCMKSGVVYGNASMVDGLLDRIIEEKGDNWRIVATGGMSKVIIPLCRRKIELDDTLLLKGLKAIYDKNKKL